MLPGSEGGSRLSPLEQVRVVAALSQLHHDVQQARPAKPKLPVNTMYMTQPLRAQRSDVLLHSLVRQRSVVMKLNPAWLLRSRTQPGIC